jgi:hypothetical protein
MIPHFVIIWPVFGFYSVLILFIFMIPRCPVCFAFELQLLPTSYLASGGIIETRYLSIFLGGSLPSCLHKCMYLEMEYM